MCLAIGKVFQAEGTASAKALGSSRKKPSRETRGRSTEEVRSEIPKGPEGHCKDLGLDSDENQLLEVFEKRARQDMLSLRFSTRINLAAVLRM